MTRVAFVKTQDRVVGVNVELGLGVDAPEKIELVIGDLDGEAYAVRIQEILMRE